jgi:hypothetical protein
MNDDWRVELDIERRHHLGERRREHELVRDARDRLGDQVAVTIDHDHLHAYAGSEEAARQAQERLQELAAAHSLQAQAILTRWHPEEQRWEPIGAPLPSTPGEHDAERRTREADQAADAKAHGYAEWEVRIDLADAKVASAVAGRLRDQGLTVVCRNRVVVIALATEDEARALAQRLRDDVPEAEKITAEGSAAVAMDELNPLSVLTGRWRRT